MEGNNGGSDGQEPRLLRDKEEITDTNRITSHHDISLNENDTKKRSYNYHDPNFPIVYLAIKINWEESATLLRT